MGLAVYIELEIAGDKNAHLTLIDGKAVAQNWDQLNALASEHGFIPLERFVSTNRDDLVNLIGEDAVTDSGVEVLPEQWFAPEEGLVTVQNLLNHLSSLDKSGVALDRVASSRNASSAAEKQIPINFCWAGNPGRRP